MQIQIVNEEQKATSKETVTKATLALKTSTNKNQGEALECVLTSEQLDQWSKLLKVKNWIELSNQQQEQYWAEMREKLHQLNEKKSEVRNVLMNEKKCFFSFSKKQKFYNQIYQWVLLGSMGGCFIAIGGMVENFGQSLWSVIGLASVIGAIFSISMILMKLDQKTHENIKNKRLLTSTPQQWRWTPNTMDLDEELKKRIEEFVWMDKAQEELHNKMLMLDTQVFPTQSCAERTITLSLNQKLNSEQEGRVRLAWNQQANKDHREWNLERLTQWIQKIEKQHSGDRFFNEDRPEKAL